MGFEFTNLGAGTGQNLERGQYIPMAIQEQNLISTNSEAAVCFVQQQFSGKLQTFMINYVISVSGLYSVYA